MFKPLAFLGSMLAIGIAGSLSPLQSYPESLILGDGYAAGGNDQTRTAGQRAHRRWKRQRAAGFTKRVRHK